MQAQQALQHEQRQVGRSLDSLAAYWSQEHERLAVLCMQTHTAVQNLEQLALPYQAHLESARLLQHKAKLPQHLTNIPKTRRSKLRRNPRNLDQGLLEDTVLPQSELPSGRSRTAVAVVISVRHFEAFMEFVPIIDTIRIEPYKLSTGDHVVIVSSMIDMTDLINLFGEGGEIDQACKSLAASLCAPECTLNLSNHLLGLRIVMQEFEIVLLQNSKSTPIIALKSALYRFGERLLQIGRLLHDRHKTASKSKESIIQAANSQSKIVHAEATVKTAISAFRSALILEQVGQLETSNSRASACGLSSFEIRFMDVRYDRSGCTQYFNNL